MAQKLRCVIVAVDSSEESINALKWALANLKLHSSSSSSAAAAAADAELEENCCLVILHVQYPPSIAVCLNPGAIPFGGPSDVEVPAFTAAIEAHQRRISQAIIDHALKICSDKNIDVKTQVLVGDPKEKICEAVENLHADLLVMGNRGFGPIKRMFLGSVSNYCSNHAQCPVMIVKDPQ